MLEYKAYWLDQSGRITGRIALLCENDEDAKRQAAALVGIHAIELWSRDRRIATFDVTPWSRHDAP
jgi:hypothetical protein